MSQSSFRTPTLLAHRTGEIFVLRRWARIPIAQSYLAARIRLWIARRRQRERLGDLALLDDHLLKDIGVSRENALREAAKSFWQQ
jgi:uncharacterized protein YjiS (DUF1127 family)